MVVYEATMFSLYANIKILRELGCQLPIEVWHRPEEMDSSHPFLARLRKENRDVQIRKIVDPRASGFLVKPYVLYHSHFDEVLTLYCLLSIAYCLLLL